jgi:hypothetical protein
MRKNIIALFIMMLSATIGVAGTTNPSSNYVWKSGYGITIPDGIVNTKQEFIAPAASNASSVVQIVLSTSAIVGSTATTSVTIPAVSRNLTVVADFDVGSDTATMSVTLSVVGVNAKGESATEAISFSTNTGTGDVAWASITSLSITASAYTVSDTATQVTYSVGTGNKLGLVNNLDSFSGVYKVVEDSSDVTPATGKFDADNDTYQPTTATNGTRNYEVHYKASGK